MKQQLAYRYWCLATAALVWASIQQPCYAQLATDQVRFDKHRSCQDKFLSQDYLQMSVPAARQGLVDALERMNRDGVEVSNVAPILHPRVNANDFQFVDRGSSNGQPYEVTRYFEFKNIDYVCLLKYPFNGYAREVDIDGSARQNGLRHFIFGYRGSGYNPAASDEENAKLLADSINRLIYESRNGNPYDRAQDTDFQSKAAAWHALGAKPALPEEARKQRVLAENAVQEKDFDAAIKYYEAGLRIFPMWPEAYFNAALVSGELGDYSNALMYIRRYLTLTPDAPDAQAARDKSYVWEAKVAQIEASFQHGENEGVASNGGRVNKAAR